MYLIIAVVFVQKVDDESEHSHVGMIITWKNRKKEELIKKFKDFSVNCYFKFKFSKWRCCLCNLFACSRTYEVCRFDPQSTNLIIIPLYNSVVIQLYSFTMRSHNNGLMTFHARGLAIVYDISTTQGAERATIMHF